VRAPLGSLRRVRLSLVSRAFLAVLAGGLAGGLATQLSYAREPAARVAAVRRMTTLLISRALDGGPPNAASTNAVISGDERRARVIAYQSAATNLVRQNTGGALNVFVIHRAGPIDNLGEPWGLGTTALVSRGLNGQPANGNSFAPAVDGTIRADPSCVAFLSAATNLTSGGGDGRVAAYVSNGLPGPISKISRGSAAVDEVKVSSDCSHIAYSAGGQLFLWAEHHHLHRVPGPGAVTGFSFAVGYTQDLVFASGGGIYLSAGGTGTPKLVARGDANPVYSDIRRHVVAYEKGQGISWRDLGQPEHTIGRALARRPVIGNAGYYITFQAGDPSRPTTYLRTDVRKLILPESLDARGRTLRGGGANPSMSFTANYIVFDSPAPLGARAGAHEIYMRYLGGI
jgi:hypothetical protein